MDNARFTINGTPSVSANGDRVFEGTNSQLLTVTLEANPSIALSVRYEVFNSADPESPFASKNAPPLTWNENSQTSILLTNVNDSVTINLPGSGAHSYLIRCTVSTECGPEVYERLAIIRTTTTTPTLRKTVPAESIEGYARAWSDAINDMVDAIANGGGGGGGLPDARRGVVWDPDIVSSTDTVKKTWAEAHAAAVLMDGAPNIYIIPSGSTVPTIDGDVGWDMEKRIAIVFPEPYQQNPSPPYNFLRIDGGSTHLINPRGVINESSAYIHRVDFLPLGLIPGNGMIHLTDGMACTIRNIGNTGGILFKTWDSVTINVGFNASLGGSDDVVHQTDSGVLTVHASGPRATILSTVFDSQGFTNPVLDLYIDYPSTFVARHPEDYDTPIIDHWKGPVNVTYSEDSHRIGYIDNNDPGVNYEDAWPQGVPNNVGNAIGNMLSDIAADGARAVIWDPNLLVDSVTQYIPRLKTWDKIWEHFQKTPNGSTLYVLLAPQNTTSPFTYTIDGGQVYDLQQRVAFVLPRMQKATLSFTANTALRNPKEIVCDTEANQDPNSNGITISASGGGTDGVLIVDSNDLKTSFRLRGVRLLKNDGGRPDIYFERFSDEIDFVLDDHCEISAANAIQVHADNATLRVHIRGVNVSIANNAFVDIGISQTLAFYFENGNEPGIDTSSDFGGSWSGTISADTLRAEAQRVKYTPTAPGNWAPIPEQVGEALDQLAAGGGGGGGSPYDVETFVFDTATADADPGSGNFRFNTTFPNSVSWIYLAHESDIGADVRSLFRNLLFRESVVVQQADDPSKYFVFSRTGDPVEDTGTYLRIRVSGTDNGGSLPDNGARCYVKPRPERQRAFTMDEWFFDNGTADANPGTNRFRLNNASQHLATQIYINNETDPGGSYEPILQRLRTGDYVIVQQNNIYDSFLIFEVTGTPVDGGSYTKIPVSVTPSGSGSPIQDNNPCTVRMETIQGSGGGGGGDTYDRESWRFDNGTADADPGSGNFRLNNGTQFSATYMYISEESINVTIWPIVESVQVHDNIVIQQENDTSKYTMYRVTGPAEHTASNYVKIPILVVDANNPFDNTEPCFVKFRQNRGINANPAVEWIPGATETATVKDTWAKAYAAAVAYEGEVRIIFGGGGSTVYEVTGGIEYDLESRIHLHHYTPDLGGDGRLEFAANTRIKDPLSIRSVDRDGFTIDMVGGDTGEDCAILMSRLAGEVDFENITFNRQDTRNYIKFDGVGRMRLHGRVSIPDADSIECDQNQNIKVWLNGDNIFFGANVFEGPASATLEFIFAAGADISRVESDFTTSFLGSVTFTYPQDSFRHDYTPTTPGDWTSVPSTIGEALDELAGSGGGGGGGTFLMESWAFSTNTTDSDPGAGNFKLNNATQGSADRIWIDNVNAAGADVGTELLKFRTGDLLLIQQAGDATRHHVFRIGTATPVDKGGYVELLVAAQVTGADLQDTEQCEVRQKIDSSFKIAEDGNIPMQQNLNMNDNSLVGRRYHPTQPLDLGAGSTNDYNPLGWALADVVEQDMTGDHTVTGFLAVAATDVVRKVVYNISSANTLTINHEDAASSAANRVVTPTQLPIEIGPGMAVTLDYNSNAARWYVAGTTAQAAAGAGGLVFRMEAWAFSTNTTDSDPGTGNFKLNNATQGSATNIWIDNVNAAGADVGTELLKFRTGDLLLIQQASDSTRHHVFRIGSATPVDKGGYVQLLVSAQVTGADLQDTELCEIRQKIDSSFKIAEDGNIPMQQNLNMNDNSLVGRRYHPTQPTDLAAGSTNDYNPLGWALADVVEQDMTGDHTVTGFLAVAATDVVRKAVYNISAANTLTINHQDVASAAANRVVTPTQEPLLIRPGQVVVLDYNSNDSRWYVVGTTAQQDVEDVPTSESNTSLVLKPDGAGGVAFGTVPAVAVALAFKMEAWAFSTNTTDSDPGAGNFKFNNATQGSADRIWIDNVNAAGADVGTELLKFRTGDLLLIQQGDDPSRHHVFRIGSSTPVDKGGYVELLVSAQVTGADLQDTEQCEIRQKIDSSFKIAEDGNIPMQQNLNMNDNSLVGRRYHPTQPVDLAAGTTNDYNPLGWDLADVVEQDMTGDHTVTGFVAVAATDVVRKVFYNISAANTLTINHQDVASAAANRVVTPTQQPIVLRPGMAVTLDYNSNDSRWYVAGTTAQSDVEDLPTSETNTALVLKPDGSGGVAFGAAPGGATELAFKMEAWNFDATTTDADPGSGNFRLNNATQGSATEIYIDDLASNGANLRAHLLDMHPGDLLLIQQGNDPTRYHSFRVNMITIITGYVRLNVTNEDSGADLQDTEECEVRTKIASNSKLAIDGSSGMTGDLDLGGNTTIGQTYRVISPPSIGGVQNDYAPTGFSDAEIVQISLTGGQTITGFEAPSVASGNARKVIYNTDATDTLTIGNEDVGSTGANRVTSPTGDDIELAPNQAIVLDYNFSTSRWYVYAHTSPIVTDKGDLLTHDGSGPIRFGVGGDGAFLRASSAAASGLDWDDQSNINVEGFGTVSTDEAFVLAPDGAGGLTFRRENAGGGGTFSGQWEYDSITTAADPGLKTFRTNSNTPASVTEVYINDTAENDIDMGFIISRMVEGDSIYIQELKDSSHNGLYQLDSAPTDNGGWWTLSVTHTESGTALDDGEQCFISFLLTSDHVKNNLTATTNPGVGDDADDGYSVGSHWLNTTGPTWWICSDNSVGAAVWTQISGGGGGSGTWTGLSDTPGSFTGNAVYRANAGGTALEDSGVAVVGTETQLPGNLNLGDNFIRARRYDDISPSAISGTTNDYDPPGFGNTDKLNVVMTGGNQTITGFAAPVSGETPRKLILNKDITDTLTITHDDVGSSSANRVFTPDGESLVLQPGRSAILDYDFGSSVWRVIAVADSNGTPGTITLKHSGTPNINASATNNFIPWDTQEIYDSDAYTHSTVTNNDNITVTEAGRYLLAVQVTAGGSDGDSRYMGLQKFRINGTDQDPICATYQRHTTGCVDGTGTTVVVLDLNAGDVIDVAWDRGNTTTSAINMRANQSTLSITRLQQGGLVGGGGGSGTPGGSDTQVQYKDGGSFGGDADFTWNDSTNTLDIEGDIVDLTTVTFKAAFDNGNSGGGTWNFNLNNGQKQFGTLTGNASITFTAPNGPGNFVIILTQDNPGSRTPTWPATGFYAPGGELDIGGNQDVSTLLSIYYDGTDYWAMASGPMADSVSTNLIS